MKTLTCAIDNTANLENINSQATPSLQPMSTVSTTGQASEADTGTEGALISSVNSNELKTDLWPVYGDIQPDLWPCMSIH